jgi:hypothetical protein
VYKLHINSTDRIEPLTSTWSNGFYYVNINPNLLDKYKDWYMSIETVLFSAELTTPYIVCFPDISLGDSTFSTLNRNIKNVLLLDNSTLYHSTLACDSAGSKCCIDEFRGKVMNIQICNPTTGLPLTDADIDWSMIITFYACSKEE